MIRYLYRLLLSLWLGALVAFGAVFAPALFRVLTPAQAGSVVRQVIPVLDAFALFAGPALIALALWREGRPRGRGAVRVALLSVMAGLALASAAVVTPRMAELRTAAGDQLSKLPSDDPVRREFGRLHGVSTGLMLGQLLLGLGVLGIPLRSRSSVGQ